MSTGPYYPLGGGEIAWPTTAYSYGYTHSCLWHAIGVQESPRESSVTVVLLRCTICADVAAEELLGKWSLAQIRGEEIAQTEPVTIEHDGMGICNKGRKHPAPCDFGSGV